MGREVAEQMLASEKRVVIQLNNEVGRRRVAQKQAEAHAAAWEVEVKQAREARGWKLVVEDMVVRT